MEVEPQSQKKLTFQSLKRGLDIFSAPDLESKKIRISHKLNLEYGGIASKAAAQPHSQNQAQKPSAPEKARDPQKGVPKNELAIGPSLQPKSTIDGLSVKSSAVIPSQHTWSQRNLSSAESLSHRDFSSKCSVELGSVGPLGSEIQPFGRRNLSTAAIMERTPSKWHPPWKNYRVISGHLGWVRSVAVDHSNSWFCTGSADRTIKIWDLATGTLKLTLTGHIQQIRGLAVSNKHTYMFSASDDKQVKCWDLEQNKVVRSYHGHLSGVHCLALHPTIDILLTGGRDSVCRVWDIRTKMQIHALSGHDNTVCSVFTPPMDPRIVVTGSHDSTIKLWDLRYDKTMATLTHHKKSVRAMALHPKEDAFASASADNIKKFNLPGVEFCSNMLSRQKTIINAMAVNDEGVMATGGDNGSLWFWDWKSGHNFQRAQTIVQPRSLQSEAGIYALTYDVSGTRLITCEGDKTIKMWKEDENATPEDGTLLMY